MRAKAEALLTWPGVLKKREFYSGVEIVGEGLVVAGGNLEESFNN